MWRSCAVICYDSNESHSDIHLCKELCEGNIHITTYSYSTQHDYILLYIGIIPYSIGPINMFEKKT